MVFSYFSVGTRDHTPPERIQRGLRIYAMRQHVERALGVEVPANRFQRMQPSIFVTFPIVTMKKIKEVFIVALPDKDGTIAT